MNTLIARQDDTLDELIFRHYGQTAGLVEQALEYNP
ncbi:bacteriophage tail synthesis protein X, partial [Mannheimia haemolytica PHL213]